MPFTANRKRPIQVKFFVDENELAIIKQRMGEFGTNNLSTYLRTMAMEGIFPTADGEKVLKTKRLYLATPTFIIEPTKIRYGWSITSDKTIMASIQKLTPYALRELVKAAYVEAPDKSSSKRKQNIHICYDLVGFIPVDELLKAEQA